MQNTSSEIRNIINPPDLTEVEKYLEDINSGMGTEFLHNKEKVKLSHPVNIIDLRIQTNDPNIDVRYRIQTFNHGEKYTKDHTSDGNSNLENPTFLKITKITKTKTPETGDGKSTKVSVEDKFLDDSNNRDSFDKNFKDYIGLKRLIQDYSISDSDLPGKIQEYLQNSGQNQINSAIGSEQITSVTCRTEFPRVEVHEKDGELSLEQKKGSFKAPEEEGQDKNIVDQFGYREITDEKGLSTGQVEPTSEPFASLRIVYRDTRSNGDKPESPLEKYPFVSYEIEVSSEYAEGRKQDIEEMQKKIEEFMKENFAINRDFIDLDTFFKVESTLSPEARDKYRLNLISNYVRPISSYFHKGFLTHLGDGVKTATSSLEAIVEKLIKKSPDKYLQIFTTKAVGEDKFELTVEQITEEMIIEFAKKDNEFWQVYHDYEHITDVVNLSNDALDLVFDGEPEDDVFGLSEFIEKTPEYSFLLNDKGEVNKEKVKMLYQIAWQLHELGNVAELLTDYGEPISSKKENVDWGLRDIQREIVNQDLKSAKIKQRKTHNTVGAEREAIKIAGVINEKMSEDIKLGLTPEEMNFVREIIDYTILKFDAREIKNPIHIFTQYIDQFSSARNLDTDNKLDYEKKHAGNLGVISEMYFATYFNADGTRKSETAVKDTPRNQQGFINFHAGRKRFLLDQIENNEKVLIHPPDLENAFNNFANKLRINEAELSPQDFENLPYMSTKDTYRLMLLMQVKMQEYKQTEEYKKDLYVPENIYKQFMQEAIETLGLTNPQT